MSGITIVNICKRFYEKFYKCGYTPNSKPFQINQQITCHLSKAYSFGTLAQDYHGHGNDPGCSRNDKQETKDVSTISARMWILY